MSLAVTALARPPMLAELSFALAPGITALVGPNGAGKTTLMRALAGLSTGPGEVRLDGAPLTPARFAYLPAERTVHVPITARNTVALGLARPDAAAVDAALARTDTARFAGTPVTRLSTGERARVLLARTLVGRPRVLLLDEPTANLDPAHALLVMDLAAEEARGGAIVLAALHDLMLARGTADRVIVLEGGCVVADGAPREALGMDVLARVFGVREGVGGLERVM